MTSPFDDRDNGGRHDEVANRIEVDLRSSVAADEYAAPLAERVSAGVGLPGLSEADGAVERFAADHLPASGRTRDGSIRGRTAALDDSPFALAPMNDAWDEPDTGTTPCDFCRREAPCECMTSVKDGGPWKWDGTTGGEFIWTGDGGWSVHPERCMCTCGRCQA